MADIPTFHPATKPAPPTDAFIAGFDASSYPGDDAMNTWFQHSPFYSRASTWHRRPTTPIRAG